MSILNEELSVFEISCRWAGYDPDQIYFRFPLLVKDNFRLLLDAILSTQLECQNLSCEKYKGSDPEEARFYMRYWEDDVYQCVQGIRFNRALLKWAYIDRSAFQSWCERRNIPLPEFWFPSGWRVEYQWDDDDDDSPLDERSIDKNTIYSHFSTAKKHSADQRIAIACQEVAINLWKQYPDMTIAAMVKHDVIQVLCGANHYVPESVRRWLSAVAPIAVKEKRGRPRKNGTEDEI